MPGLSAELPCRLHGFRATCFCDVSLPNVHCCAVHAAWCGAGLVFLSLWALGRLRAFSAGGARPAQLLASLAPLFAAGWVGVTRIQNNR